MNSRSALPSPVNNAARARLSRVSPAVPPQAAQAGALLATFAAAWLGLHSLSGQRWAFSLALMGVFFVLLARNPLTAVSVMLPFLALTGGLRRWLIPFLDYESNDPLMLVVPVVLAAYLSAIFLQKQIVLDTKLSRMIRWLLVWMTIEVVNPLQGGPLVGVAGALFYIVPILWYFVGRQAGSMAMLRRLYLVALVVAFAGALYGFKQTWWGLAASEEEWMRLTKFTQTLANGSARTFSFFTNGGEYSMFVGVGVVALWAAFLKGKRLAILPLPLLLAAIFLGSYRSAVVAALLACAAMWAVEGRAMRTWIPRGVIAALVAVVGLNWSLQQASQLNLDNNAQAAIKHQIDGLYNPSKSTANGHASLFTNGILSSFTRPLGLGLGATTLAGSKYGGTGGGTGSEMDISDMFLSLGPAGGALYLAVVLTVFRMAFRYWLRTRSVEALTIIGLLFLYMLHWLQSGYTGYMLVWFSIGVLERASRALDQQERAASDAQGQAPLAQGQTAQGKQEQTARGQAARARGRTA